MEELELTLNRVAAIVFGFFPFEDHVGFVVFENVRRSRSHGRVERIFDDDAVRRTHDRRAHAVHVFRGHSEVKKVKDRLRTT